MEIQPRSFGDSLADVVTNLGKVWRPLLGPAIITSVIMGLLTILAFETTDSFEIFELVLNNPEALEFMSDEELVDTLVRLGTGIMLVSLVSTVVYGFLYLAAARAVGRAYAIGNDVTVVGAAIRLFPIWLIATIMAGVAIIAGLLLLVLPGLWLAIMFTMYTPVIAVEGKGAVAALKRSFELVRGHFWETVGFLLIVGLIGGAAGQLFQLVAIPMFMTGEASFAFGLAFAMGVVGQGLIMAAIAVATTTWYLNLRARTDGPYLVEIAD
ncbi:MAG: hypothetical protein ACFCU2_05230 [Acidimicrobiia bacterium]